MTERTESSMARLSHENPSPTIEQDATLHDELAEQAVIGCVLLDDARFPEVAGALDVPDFFTEKHRRIFSRMRDLSARGARIDRITLHGRA